MTDHEPTSSVGAVRLGLVLAFIDLSAFGGPASHVALMDSVETLYVPPNEADFLLPDEAVWLLDAIRESEYELPILVGLYGLRPSEYLALPWRHLSIESREERVVQASAYGTRGDQVGERRDRGLSLCADEDPACRGLPRQRL